jgi:hypothetical protein
MKQFKDFGIKVQSKAFQGDKIKIERLLNREITVHEYRIENSKFNGKCLWLQISLGDMKYVVFTGSLVLMDTIEQVPKENFPFLTTIIKDNERFEFS